MRSTGMSPYIFRVNVIFAITTLFSLQIQTSALITIGDPTLINDEAKFISCLRQDVYNSSRFLACTYTSLETYDLETNSFSLIAGTADKSFGYKEGQGAQARFFIVYDVVQLNESTIVVSDYFNHCLRTVTDSVSAAFAGQCTERGYGDGAADSEAMFDGPRGLALSWSDSEIYIADTFNFALRKINVETGIVSTLAKGSAEFFFGVPQYIVHDLNPIRWEIFYVTAPHGGLLEFNTTSGEIVILLNSVEGPQDSADPLPISPSELLYIGSPSLILYDIPTETKREAVTSDLKLTAMSCMNGYLYLWSFGQGMYKRDIFGLTTDSLCY